MGLHSSCLSGSDTLSDSLTEISELTGYQEYQISEISVPIFCFAGSIRRQFFVLRGPSGANFLFYGVHPTPIFCFTGPLSDSLTEISELTGCQEYQMLIPYQHH